MEWVNWYHGIIEEILLLSGLDDQTVHIGVGMAIWLAAMLVVRRPSAPLVALAAVILAEAGNETIDRLYAGTWNWPDTVSDALATWIAPSILTALLIWSRQYRDMPAVS